MELRDADKKIKEEDLNTYEGIAKFYDVLMMDGYYDYNEISKNLNGILGNRKRVLELGVGTGLVVEHLLKVNSDFLVTGIDNTQAMIDQARERLGDKIEFKLEDVTTLNLDKTFEAAFSVGGCWYYIDKGDEIELCSHIDDLETTKRGLTKVVNHLEPGGLLVLSLQGVHTNYSKGLPDGLTYTQEVKNTETGFTKRYLFRNGDEIVAEQFYSYLILSNKETDDFFATLGCEPVGLSQDRKFFTYKKSL